MKNHTEESHDRPRGAKTADLGRGAGRPLNDSVAATGHIHLRVTLARKGWYVRTARLYNQTLAEWMQQECDKSSSYPPQGQNETTSPNGKERPSKCPQCGVAIVQINLGNGQTDDYCEECEWPPENRPAYIPPGELKITYAKLQQVINECCSQIESAPGEPPEGYDVENAELVKVADASWEQAMRQLGTALLNWAYDELQAPAAAHALELARHTCLRDFQNSNQPKKSKPIKP